MQNTIDNIQKELTGRPAVVENRIQPEQDDNAVMLTPGQKVVECWILYKLFSCNYGVS